MATELSLNGKAEFPRTLSISVGHHHMTVALYVEAQKIRKKIAFATTKFSDCYLRLDKYVPALWIGSTAFDVTAAEAQQIRSAYEPLHLKVEGTP